MRKMKTRACRPVESSSSSSDDDVSLGASQEEAPKEMSSSLLDELGATVREALVFILCII